MRAVVDANVIISAILSANGVPAKVLRAWLDGAYELVASPLSLQELERALSYPKLRERVTKAEAGDLIELLRNQADVREDPTEPPLVRSPNPGDDYLIALAAAEQAVIVSGDGHLLGLGNDIPVHPPAAFLSVIERNDQ